LYGSASRGGTLMFVSGELRLALPPADLVSPFAIAGIGRGVSRPNVNAAFPTASATIFACCVLLRSSQGGECGDDGGRALWP
jgi:hypothetical protein